jgi:alpha-L-arabinofuranosidase
VQVRLSLGDAVEIAEARDWVEYLNGHSSTRMGALRAKRLGHAEPYNVQYFYLGNELWQQRCPHYPQDTSCMHGPNATEYATIAHKLVAAMQAASPTPLRLLTAMSANPADGWDQAWIDAVGVHVYAASDHDGYHNQPAKFEATALTSCAKAPRDIFAPSLRRRRSALDAKGAAHVAISADEWGLGPPWEVAANFSVAHGVYAAAFLGAVTRIAPEVKLAFTNYFEPVNEGAVYVGPFKTVLTPVGEAMALYADHAGVSNAAASTLDLHRHTHKHTLRF